MESALRGRLEAVRADVPPGVTLIVVTKFHPASLVRELHELGVRDFGESRQQEAGPKAAALADLGLTCISIGQLQSNKAKGRPRVRERAALAGPGRPRRRADRRLHPGEPDRATRDAGASGPACSRPFAEQVLDTRASVSPASWRSPGSAGTPRGRFARVRGLRDEILLPVAPGATSLSMGMSGDYREAIREGATHLRIGTAITGNRPDPAYSRP